MRNLIAPIVAVATSAIFPYFGFAENIILGYKEVGGVTVTEGTQEADGNVVVGSDAEFRKAGAGEYVLPAEKLDTNLKSKMVVTGGKLKLTSAAATTSTAEAEELGAVASNIMAKAAFWVDETSTVTTNAEGETTQYVTKWCDVREPAASRLATPTLTYALPVWPAVTNGSAHKATQAGIPPTLQATNDVTAVYFGGRFSGKTMNWVKGGTTATTKSYSDIYHIFVVHGVFTCWAPVIGYNVSSRGGGMLLSTGSMNPSCTDLYGTSAQTLEKRVDLNPYATCGRWFLDGEKFDPFSIPPKPQFQMLEFEAMGKLFAADNFMSTRFETFIKNSKYLNAPGGDYIGEVVIFTNNLMEAERVAVERFLMKKWKLPNNRTFTSSKSTVPQRNNYVTTAAAAQIATNAIFEVNTESGKDSLPFSYSGEGTLKITGEGQAIVGPADGRPWSGTLDWDGEGAIVTRGGALPPLDVSAGQKYVVGYAGTYGGTASQAADAAGGMKLTRSNDAGAGRVEIADAGDKSHGWVRVRKVDSDVKRLKVNARVVQLQGKVNGDTLVEDAPLSVYIPNADFEDAFTPAGTHNRLQFGSAGLNNWFGYGGSYLMRRDPDTSWHAWVANKIYPRGGMQMLQLVQEAYAYTTITIPKDGYYEFDVDAMARYGSTQKSTSWSGVGYHNNQNHFIRIMLGPDWKNASTYATMAIDSMPMKTYRFKIGPLTAGQKVIGFYPIDSGADACTFFDNLKLTYIADKEDGRGETALANGDFETQVRRESPWFSMGLLTILNQSKGWNLSVSAPTVAGRVDYTTNAYLTNSVIAVINGAQQYMSGTTPVYQQYRVADGKRGSHSLIFNHDYGKAVKEFLVLPGTYRLKGTICSAPIWRSGDQASGYAPEVEAKVSLDGGANFTSLGKTMAKARGLSDSRALQTETCYWPNTFTVEGEAGTKQTITISLANTKYQSSGIVDDLVLIEATRGYEDQNLVVDTGFDYRTVLDGNAIGWNNYGCARAWDHAYPWAYGYNYFPSQLRTEALEVQTTGTNESNKVVLKTVRCKVTVPEAGLYRCKMHFRTRIDGYEGSEYWVFAHKTSDNTQTNMFMRFYNFYQRNYHEEEALANLEAGDYYFGVCAHNLNVYKDKYTTGESDIYCDQMSLTKVNESVEATPEMPDNLKIEVGEKCMLQLDYSGTKQCGGVKYNGQWLYGEISQATHPEFVVGMGKLDAVQVKDGFIMLLK